MDRRCYCSCASIRCDSDTYWIVYSFYLLAWSWCDHKPSTYPCVLLHWYRLDYASSLSTGQGTVTRFPQLTQVASRKYQISSKSSKLAITLNTCDPQGHTWRGPKALRSLPKACGRCCRRLNRRRVGRRNRTVTIRLVSVRPLWALICWSIRLTAHSLLKLVVSLRDDTP